MGGTLLIPAALSHVGPLFAGLVACWCDPRPRQVFPQVMNVLPTENAGMMRLMQHSLCPVQQHPEPSPGKRFHGRAEMMKQRFHFPPVDISTDGIAKDCTDEIDVFVAHGGNLSAFSGLAQGPLRQDVQFLRSL